MKSPKTKFIVISAIALASTVGILVLAQSPIPSPKPEDLPFHVIMKCATVDRGKLLNALTDRPTVTYKFQYQRQGNSPIEDLGGGALPIPTATPCPSDRLNGNATQRAVFANTEELHKFLKKAGL
jgi:hypothetical protein